MSKEKEEKKKKKKLKWQVKFVLFIIFIIICAFVIGPSGIFIKEYKITSKKITDNMHGKKVLQFSDLHYGSTTNKKTVKKLVKKINSTKPDIVIFTGDLISKNYNVTEDEKKFLVKELSNISAEYGKFYICGEEDHEEADNILNLSDFINLKNNTQQIFFSSSDSILISDKESTKSYFEENEVLPDFKLLAIHNPKDLNKEMLDYNYDVAIAGHTHNGTINIIGIKKLFIKTKYQKGYQKVKNTKLYINNGIGTHKIKARLFNHPTINLYRLNKASTK